MRVRALDHLRQLVLIANEHQVARRGRGGSALASDTWSVSSMNRWSKTSANFGRENSHAVPPTISDVTRTSSSSRVILALMAEGRRVAVMSNSHEAVLNVLRACIDALLEQEDAPRVQIAQKGSRDMDELPERYGSIHMVRTRH